MQKYAKYSPSHESGTHSLYFLFIFHFFGCVYKKKKKKGRKKKLHLHKNPQYILITICESIFSLFLSLCFSIVLRHTTRKRAHEKKTSVAEEQERESRGSKRIVKGEHGNQFAWQVLCNSVLCGHG